MSWVGWAISRQYKPTQPELPPTQTHSQARCKEFPHAVVAKVFCFGHSFEAEQQAGGLDALEAGFKQHKDQLVVFPPEGDDRVALDGGVSMVGYAPRDVYDAQPDRILSHNQSID